MITTGILLITAGFLIGKPGITANVVRENSMSFNDYIVASSLGLSIILLMAGFVFYFRVRPGN